MASPTLMRRALASPSRDTTTLTVMYAANELTPAYVKAFEQANPDITVRVINNDQTTFNSMLAAGKPPDIYRSEGFSSISYAVQGVFQDLTPYLAKSTLVKEADLAPVNNLYRWDGKTQGKGALYGLVKDWSLDNTLWYNAKLLKAAGYKLPSETESLSLTDMLAMAKKLTITKSGQTAVYGFDMGWGWQTYTSWLMVIAQAQGASLFSADLKKANFTSPEVLKGLQFLVDYANAKVGTSPILTDSTSPTGPVVAGRTALAAMGYWFGQQVATDSHHLTDYIINAPAPHWGGTRLSPCVAGVGMSMTSGSKNKDAAWKLMEWFIGGPPAIDRVTGGWGLNSLKHLASQLPSKTAFDRERFRVVQNDIKYFKPLIVSPYADYNSMSIQLTTAITQVLKGNATVAAAGKTVEAAVNRLITQGIAQAGG